MRRQSRNAHEDVLTQYTLAPRLGDGSAPSAWVHTERSHLLATDQPRHPGAPDAPRET